MNPFVLDSIPDLRPPIIIGTPRALDVPSPQTEKVVRVLVLDEPTVVSERLVPLVHRAGARALLAQDGEEVMRMFRARPPVAVVMDLTRAARNEFALLLRIRIRAPNCEVILLTNEAGPELREKAIRHGADHFFDATSQLHDVAAVVASLVRVANQPPGRDRHRMTG